MRFTEIKFFMVIFWIIFLITHINQDKSYAASTSLPKFLTKQSLEFLRYIDKEGKFTYYQTSTGQLNMTTNYDNTLLYESIKGSHFQIHSSPNQKMLLIELIEHMHSKLNFTKNHRIFTTEVGSKALQEVAQGRVPVLALDNNWLAYYTHETKTAHFKPLKSTAKEIKVVLNNEVNNFFMPQLNMLTPDTVIFTDINKQGNMAIITYNATDKKFHTIYKSKFAGMKLEYCLSEKNLIVGEFSLYDINKGSSLTSIPLYGNKNYQQKNIFYRTTNNDLGNLLCKKNNIYFIKALSFNSDLNSTVTEVAKIDLKTKELKILSDLRNVTQILSMGDKVLIPYRQSYYIIEGKYDTTKQDILDEK